MNEEQWESIRRADFRSAFRWLHECRDSKNSSADDKIRATLILSFLREHRLWPISSHPSDELLADAALNIAP